MRPGRSVIVVMGWIFMCAAGCSTSGDLDTDLVDRIDRVINSLHARTSLTSVTAEKWTLAQRMAHYGVPAVSIAVIHESEIQWARAYETASVGVDTAVSGDRLFQAASISKPLTAFAVLRMADQKLLDLDAPVNLYLQSWKLPDGEDGSADSVTMALLLAHMAGLNVPGFPGYPPGATIPTLTQILDGASPANTPAIRIVRKPGTTWSYSGGGYAVLQQALQDVSQQDFPRLMKDLVLEPLGMKNSTFQQPLPRDLEPLAAVGHKEDGGIIPGRWHVYPEMAAAGLWTTASDLARFILAVEAAANRSPASLLSAQSAAALTEPRFGSFSLGLLVRRNGKDAWFTYNGGNAGYRALMVGYLTVGEGAVVMTNSDAGMALASEIINAIALEYSWPGFIPEELQ